MPRPMTGRNPGPMAASVMWCLLGSGGLVVDAVGDERRAVVGHEPGGLADAQARRLVADDPGAQGGAEPVELGQRVEQLVDEALVAVDAAGGDLVAGRDDRDVRTLT